MIKVPWWKKIALYLLTHGEQNHLELQSWREEKEGINSWIWKTLLMIWIIYLCNHNLAKVIEEVMDRMVEFHNLMPKCAEIKSQILQSWFRSVRELLIQLIIRQSSSQGSQALKLSRQSNCQGSQAVKAVKLSRQSSCQGSQDDMTYGIFYFYSFLFRR